MTRHPSPKGRDAKPGAFDQDSASWLLLTCLPGVGPKSRAQLLEQWPSPIDLLSVTRATLGACGLPTKAVNVIQAWQRRDRSDPVVSKVLWILDQCSKQNIQILTFADPCYPEPLRHIHDAPWVLFALGDVSLLQREQIAIVGSRNATPSGLSLARRFAAELSACSLLVTSGLALGVDGAAHAGALDVNAPTLAVIGCGLDNLYPGRHRPLARRILERGLLVSEYPPGTPARPAHFPQRNRIISGLARGVLVVEAGLKSGSLITARLAMEQGREVFAIPGPVQSPVSRGCHHLIKQGAALVESVEDIVAELGASWQQSTPLGNGTGEANPLSGLEHREIAVFEALGYDPQSTDALSFTTGLSADQLMQSLLLLELQGLVTTVPGGYQRTS
ncbi:MULTISPECIES: DNA-processing protein DprA [Marinobacter]|uniref:DNA-processing protein DprA n=1 Tax=Marinobacter suaedae TaxID=3057675 RepID=A0ABT8VZQ1_9GAMM|nr:MULTISPECIES: DNA-processing protein DprA [unclassified Marinobacter]MBZ2169571.1 DNA-processing protein DprA [Marinobacter sp. F4216]MDO3721403.1 DNA-processing protein DprA [Marinobacter sp. chi1]